MQEIKEQKDTLKENMIKMAKFKHQAIKIICKCGSEFDTVKKFVVHLKINLYEMRIQRLKEETEKQ